MALSIKAASSLSGVSIHTLRAWERRYQTITPIRSPSGRRVYTLADVDHIRLLNRLVQAGHSIGKIAALPASELQHLDQRINTAQSADSPHTKRWVDQALVALEQFELERLRLLLSRARQVLGVREYTLGVITPLLSEIGKHVYSGKLSIAQEHATSKLVRDEIALLHQLLEGSAELRDPLRAQTVRRFLLATPPDDHHEFGLLLSSVLIALRGCPFDVLGTNLPANELVRSVGARNTGCVLLGVTHKTKTLDSYFDELHSLLPVETELWVGGRLAQELERTLPAKMPARKMTFLDSLQALDQKLGLLQ